MKKITYHIVSILGGVMLSFVLHAVLEVIYINHSLEKGLILEPSKTAHTCFLPLYLQIAILLTGIIGGYFFGRWGWDIVYVKNRRFKGRE